ncbi:MAG: Ni/Fe hydrogenase subunit alpha [Ignavibacteriales bacterium]|nr:Ni/Fe hydrogenase subunit alpha [Ignavibacteriales bacterium]MBI3788938.1 Ni/Fe hydrogenase subunit alpha [Ignavibacteriales bacterium]
MKNKTLKVDYLARVEGEGALLVKVKDKTVTEVKFRIFEPPRFFEAFLRGRDYSEAPDITARICGICPVAYQMSSVHAMENAFGVKVDGQLRALRRLLYCGEWIESHVLHVYMLHAPDFLGYEDVIRMAKDHGDAVKRALKLKKIGNDIVNIVGGREIHPINVRVGGFYKLPTKQDLQPLIERLKWAIDASLETVKLMGTLPFPDFERDYEFVALRHETEYPFNEGRLISNKGLDIAIQDYENNFIEEHVEHSNALHSIMKQRGAYFVGPLARYSLNFDRLTPTAQQAARAAGLGVTCNNPFKGIIVRSVETVYACEEALRIIQEYERPEQAAVKIEPRAGVGYGCTEAPRGILYHRYRIGENGDILDAKIVPPTSQNQKTIEEDLRQFVPDRINLPQEQLTWQCEQAIRNYDPCISCATHFLKLKIEKDETG